MQPEILIDPSIESAVLGLDLSALPEDFLARHESIIQEYRQRLVGALGIGAVTDETLPQTEVSSELLNSTRQAEVTDDKINELRSSFLTERTILTAVKALDNQRQSRELSENEEDLPHQQLILDDVLKALSAGKKEGFVELATNGGKTFLESKLADIFVKARLRVLVLGPTKTISGQIIGADGRKGLGRFASPEVVQKIGKHFGGSKAKPTDQLVVSTYQSYNSFSRDGRLGQFDVILCDELHRALGEKTAENVKEAFPNAIKLGFTATPVFGVNKSVDQVLPEPIHSLNLREAIDSGIATSMQCVVYSTGHEIDMLDPKHKDFTDRELRRLINLKTRNQKAIEFAKDFVQSGRQGIIACVPGAELAHARLLADELSNQDIVDKQTGETRKIIAKAVGSSIMTDKELEEALEQYANGEIDVLTFVNVLGEGWDSQKASFIINACPTTSIVKITQQIGRVTRKKADGIFSIVVDFVDEAIGKIQKTALHALGEEVINIHKIYGPRSEKGDGTKEDSYLRGILSDDIYYHLLAVDGRLIADLTIPSGSKLAIKTTEYYERLLRKDGLYPNTDLSGIPVPTLEALKRAEDEFLSEYNRWPTPEELLDLIDAKRYLGTSLDYKQLENLRKLLMLRDIDLVGTMIDDENEPVDDSFDNLPFGDPQEEIWPILIAQDVRDELNSEHLMGRERDILRLRFGLSDGRLRTLEDVAQSFKITRERIRQAEARTLAKLRHPVDKQRLYGYIDPDREVNPDEIDKTRVALLQKLSREPLGFQALFINILPPLLRKNIFDEDREHFSPVIQDYLARLVNQETEQSEEQELTRTTFDSKWNMFTYEQLKRIVAGDYNDYLAISGSNIQTMIAKFVASIPKRLLNNAEAKPNNMDELRGKVATEEEARFLRAIVESLHLSERITQVLTEIHEALNGQNPNHLIPPQKEIMRFYHRVQTYDITALSSAWQLHNLNDVIDEEVEEKGYWQTMDNFGLSAYGYQSRHFQVSRNKLIPFLVRYKKAMRLN